MPEPEPFGRIISRRGTPGRKAAASRLDVLAVNWGRLAGEKLSAHTSPTRLSRGVLTISAEGAAWASEASMHVERILAGASALLGPGAVRKVRVRSAAKTREGPPADVSAEAARAAAEGVRLDPGLAGRLAEIPEEETRGALERLLRASKAASRPSNDDEKP